LVSESNSLVELLAQHGIRLKRLWPGHNEHIVCEACGGGRTREASLSVTIDPDGEGATWICHRGNCSAPPGGARVHREGNPARDVPHQKPAPATDAQQTNRPDWLYSAFSERNIGARTVNELGIYGAERSFPHPVGRSPAIVFPYRHHGEVVNRKYRPFPAKNPMTQEKDALPTLFNVDRLGDAPAEIVWVEGEMDVAAMFECGVRHAVTLKDGAPATFRPETDPNAKRFEALRTHAAVLAKATRIVLAGDSDDPGIALREELARRLGRHRCHLVTWPDDCKDACDVLQKRGPDAVLQALADAQPYPIAGLHTVTRDTLEALRRIPPPAVMSTGTEATDNILKLPTEGRLIVVTGWPGSGKTNWTRFVMVHTMRNHNRRWAVFSPEMQPWEQFAAECAEVWSEKPFWTVPGIESMSRDEVHAAADWFRNRLIMIVSDAEDEPPTIDWLLEHARITALRDGVTDLLIDPWNEIDHSRPIGVTETEYIGRALQRFKAFGLRHGCNIWLIAHPAKPQPLHGNDKRGHPGGYDISGTAHWFNRADLGLTVHVPSPDIAELHVWKSRFVRRWGKRGGAATMNFDPIVGRYSTPVDTNDPPRHWQDS
jgi:twinkle protein